MKTWGTLTNVAGVILGLPILSPMYAQDQPCPITGTKNGEFVRLNAEAIHSAHDGLLRVAGCADEIVFEYADDPSFRDSNLTLKKDETFLQFTQYFRAEQPAQPNTICNGCWKYRVIAEFEGRLDIAPSAGWKKDPKSSKVIGVEGFGHPVPFTRYRLVVTKVAKIETVEFTTTPDR